MAETPVGTINPPIEELKGATFCLTVPEGWADRSVYCAGGPIAEGFQVSITVTIEHKPDLVDLRKFADERIENLGTQLDGFKLLDRGESKVAGSLALSAHYSWSYLNSIPLRQTQWFTHTAPNVAVITATAHETAFDELKPVF